VQFLIKTNCVDNAKKIWWDVRPHPFFPTLEYRICDVPMRVEETICIAALFQAITYKLWSLYRRNMGWRLYRRMLLNENKARAARFGIQGKLIDFSRMEEVPYTELLEELLAFVDDVVDDLGSREAVYYARTIVARGTGADRQLQKYEETKDLKAVVDYIISETEHGVI
jgi:glutamate---cysteine ligase / carboxylate-amine ligase